MTTPYSKNKGKANFSKFMNQIMKNPAPRPKRKAAGSKKSVKQRVQQAEAVPLVPYKGPSSRVEQLKDVMYMDPFGKTLPPVNDNSMGNFNCINSLTRSNLVLSNTHDTIVVILPSYRGIWRSFSWDQTGAYLGTSGVSLALLTSNPPSTSKPLRCGFKLRNSTVFTNQSGVIRVCTLSSGIEWEWAGTANLAISAALASELVNICNTNPKSVEYTMSSLSEQKDFVIPPASMSDYNRYDTFSTYNGADATLEGLIGNTVANTPMATTVILVPRASSATTIQSVSMTIGSQDGCRYPGNDLLNSLAITHKDDHGKILDKSIKAAVTQGSLSVTPSS